MRNGMFERENLSRDRNSSGSPPFQLNPTRTKPEDTPKMSGRYAFTKTVKELRFLFCQTSEHSNAVRSFLTRAYPIMKKNNPHVPILIREGTGTLPRVYARYELGQEKTQSLEGIVHCQIPS
ncbi:hypothetical protein SAPIO_CDS5187 [Scedosporium apiospermum]|uniref:Ribosomal protein/NADH dehydrogenase domain-containing protein n=1 Tax=Pseudallescheria apiosperma TaxID=563466 RepID=A0A084G617_PSEDA|nr:uncharacterized protein SAPIO_CDS5187 [Scedosporium apiospermum]KEZ42779.1 hypothetical protein SAPIO_CDS5187 [Scedosporium apiospermum]